MQLSKFMPLVCAAVFCAGFISARAGDNPAQAAARVALEQKMREMDAQQASTNAETSPVIALTPSGTTPEQTDPPAIVTMIPAQPVSSTDTAIQAQAREALQQKMSQLDKQQAAETTTPSDTATQAAARAALYQKMRELDAQEASTNAPTSPVMASKPSLAMPVQTPVAAVPAASGNYPGKELGLKPIEPPVLPISADKQAQLQALLSIYKSDQITPAEYQAQRAKILAEP